jgi:hypothetical protein
MNFVDEKFAAEKHSACAIARLTHSTQGAIDSNLCDVTQTRPGPRPGTTVHKIGYTKLDTQNWIHKIGQRITSGLAANPSSNSSQCREKAKSSMRHSEPNRRLMFVMRRFLYIDPDAALLHLSLRVSFYFSLLGKLDDLVRLWRPDHRVDPPACNPSGNQSLCAQEILL